MRVTEPMPSLTNLKPLLTQWETDSTLLEPANVSRRMEILDQLDRYSSQSELLEDNPCKELLVRSQALSSKLESINSLLFQFIREQIQCGVCPSEFQTILEQQASTHPHGFSYDYLDDLLAGVFQFDPPHSEPQDLGPDSVFYQPTPARHIFQMISAAAITETDTLIDLGSGLGHVPLLASICTGATSIGIELDSAWVASAEMCASKLNLRKVSFNAQDVREADLSSGTVFYLYTPFTGATLSSVLDSLRAHAAMHPIRICAFGPVTLSLSMETWMRPVTPPATDRITVFLPNSN
ncbi:MAG: hypothetical protein JST28_20605 [Acidobacteria bacterium]|nr:hypothetical protein [Acidobacteriota bacterium]